METAELLNSLGAAQRLTRDTNLRINSWNSASGVTLTIVVRRLGPDGRLCVDEFDHVPNTDRSRKQTTHQLAEGSLVSIQAYISAGSAQRGQCLVRVELVFGNSGAIRPLATLLQDYITTATAVSWPGSLVRSPLEGPGMLRSLTGTDPAAGAECSDTVPTGARWRLIAARFPLVTEVTAGNRFVTIILDDGVTNLFQSPDNTAHVANVTISHVFADGLGTFGTTAVNYVGPLPRNPILLAGWRIRTSTQGLTGLDNYGAPQYDIEEWLEV
jgi:hypothetical protein